MARLKVIYYPHPCIRTKTQTVTEVTDEIRKLVEDMYETMYEENGIGLAANQVNVSLRIFTMDVSEDRSERLCAINPEIISTEGEQEVPEGCLSYPGYYDNVIRPVKVRFKALDINGQPYEKEVEGTAARCVQHEVDHLDGKVFVERLSRLKQERARKKLEKFIRNQS